MSVNPPSLEAAEPTLIVPKSSITEPKVEIPPKVTKPEQKLAEDSTEEVIIEQLPDPEAVKPSLSTTEVCVLLLCGVGDSVTR